MLVGTYESQIQEVLQKYLRPGDVFYDVGAHRGYLSLLGCVLVGPAGHVYSFEPIPGNASVLQQVMAANDVTNQTLTPAAVSSNNGTTELFLGDGNDYRASMFPWKKGDTLKVESITLDAFAAEHRHPTLVKIDVEGAEALVLEGSYSILSNATAPIWVIEVHSEEADRRVNELLARHRYRCRYLPSVEPDKTYPRHLVAEQ